MPFIQRVGRKFNEASGQLTWPTEKPLLTYVLRALAFYVVMSRYGAVLVQTRSNIEGDMAPLKHVLSCAVVGITSCVIAFVLPTAAFADVSTWTLSVDPTAPIQPDGSWLVTTYFSCDAGAEAVVSVTIQDVGSGANGVLCDGTAEVATVLVTPDPGNASTRGCEAALAGLTEGNNRGNDYMGVTAVTTHVCSG